MALWNYVCFGGYQEHDTNEHGRTKTVQSLYDDQGPLRPGKLMSKFTRCSHPFLLIHINSFISQRKRRHLQPVIPCSKNVLPTPCDIPHLTLSLSRPILVHSSIHLHRCPSSAKSKPTPDPSTIPSSPLNAEAKTAAALVSDASITIVNLRRRRLRYKTEQGFPPQPKHRSLVHISLRLVIFGNWMFEVVVACSCSWFSERGPTDASPP